MPAFPGLPIPSLTGGAGGSAGPANGTANNGLSLPMSSPTNIDGSGWVVNFGNGNSTDAKGNSGANQTQQTATAHPSSSGSGSTAQPYIPASLPGGYSPQPGGDMGDPGYYDPLAFLSSGSLPLILGAVGVLLILTK